MNDRRRNRLREAIKLLDRASDMVSMVNDEEGDCLDSMPENLRSGDRCVKMEEAIDALDDAVTAIDDAKDLIDKAME